MDCIKKKKTQILSRARHRRRLFLVGNNNDKEITMLFQEKQKIVIKLTILSSLLLLISSNSLATTSAVVRPTIFSDLPPGQQDVSNQAASASATTTTTSDGSNQATASSEQQQKSLKSQHHHQPTHFSAHWQHHHQADQQQGPMQQQQLTSTNANGSNNNKINPLKSRYCMGPGTSRLDRPLGLQSFGLDDFSLSASSYSNEQVRPHLARLKQDLQGGAWCPGKPISNSNFGKEWIQVRLNRSHVITAIETQGRFGMGSGKEFAPSYQIEYSRNGGQTWHKYKDFRGPSLLKGNDDVNTPVRNELSPPIVGANVIRLLPHSVHLRTVCLRLELHGCIYDEGAPIAYETLDGVVEPRWGHLMDYTYDGLRSRTASGAVHLSAGLGQLVDGVRGPDNFSQNQGFEWVGWKSMNGDVVIEFTFATLRNFSAALFHSNNLFSSGVEVFQAVDVHYGIEPQLGAESLQLELWERERRQRGSSEQYSSFPNRFTTTTTTAARTLWSSDVSSIEYEPDKRLETARPVTVHLKQRLANKLRFVLKFASKWILVSEVEFSSRPVELMSLGGVTGSGAQDDALLSALEPAKSYDEYVAILREHQLRREATDAYLEGFATSTQASSSSSFQAELADNLDTSRLVSGPPIPMINNQQPPVWPSDAVQPATNPLLSQQPLPPAPPVNLAEPSSNNNNNNLFAIGNNKQLQPADAEEQRASMGPASLVALASVALLLLVAAILTISSYRLRRNGARHLSRRNPFTAGSSTASSSSTRTKNLIEDVGGLFAAVAHSSQTSGLYNQTATGPRAQQQFATISTRTGAPVGQDQASSASSNCSSNASASHYNPLFANHASFRHHQVSTSVRPGPLSSLRQKLAKTLGSPLANSQPQQMIVGQQQQQQSPHQLLVSLKDSSSSAKSYATGNHHHHQLIVGLNQANPMAQQQIYSSHLLGQANYSLQQESPQPTYMSDYATPEMGLDSRFNHQQANNNNNNNNNIRTMISNPLHQENLIQFRQQQQHQRAAEHNYELIYEQQQQQQQQDNKPPQVASRTLANLHQRRQLSQSQHHQNGCQNPSPFNSMTLTNDAIKSSSRPQRDEAASNHYYYADTEAASQLACRPK